MISTRSFLLFLVGLASLFIARAAGATCIAGVPSACRIGSGSSCVLRPGTTCRVPIIDFSPLTYGPTEYCCALGGTCIGNTPSADGTCGAPLGGNPSITCDSTHGNCDGSPANGCEIDFTSPATCGSCGNNCNSNLQNVTGVGCSAGTCTYSTCSSGSFASCDANSANGCETNLTNDKNNCGSCGNVCENLPQVATATCGGSACSISTCDSGYANCNGTVADGCEVNFNTNPAHCGGPACGNACSTNNINRTCVGGSCEDASATCTSTDFADCDGNKRSNGCETDLRSNKDHCGNCATDCDLAVANTNGATISCAASACTYTGGSCASGFGDCDGNKANGCERNTNSGSTIHCGGCGMGCSTSNITATCSGGSCESGACATDYLDCDGNKRSNGCEVARLTNTQNCGACGNNCDVNVGHVVGTVSCAAGACTYAGTCAAGFADVDGLKTNGCEVNLKTNPNHCGTPNNVCTAPSGGTPTCVDGVCDFTCAAKRCGDVCSTCCVDSDCPLDTNKCKEPKCTNPGAIGATCGFTDKVCVQKECYSEPTCEPTTGECQSTPRTGGAACGTTGCCATPGTCNAGVCNCGSPLDCSTDVPPCNTGLCDADTGACTTETIANGTACSPTDKCLEATTCSAGDCIGTPKVCAPSGQCRVATCDSGTGDCSEVNASPGTACSTGNSCTQNEVCNAVGECVGSTLADDTPCSSTACTSGATCQAGACTCPATGTDGGSTVDASIVVDMSSTGAPPDLTEAKGADKGGCSTTALDPSMFSLAVLAAAMTFRRRRTSL